MTELKAIDGSKIGIIGVSRGGELAFLIASNVSTIDLVIGYVASGVVWEAADEHSLFSIEGEPHPYLVGDFSGTETQKEPIRYDQAHRRALENADEDALEAATIAVEDIDGAVLLLSGGDDRLWPSQELSEHVIQRLNDHEFDYRMRTTRIQILDIYSPFRVHQQGGS